MACDSDEVTGKEEVGVVAGEDGTVSRWWLVAELTAVRGGFTVVVQG